MSRTRTKLSAIPQGTFIKYTPEGQQVRQPPYPYKGRMVEDRMTDEVTARFAKRRRAGEVIMNGLSQERCDVDMKGAEYQFQVSHGENGKIVYDANERTDPQWMPDPEVSMIKRTTAERRQLLALTVPDMPMTQAQLVAKAAAKVAETDVCVLTTAAELDKTIDSLGDASRVFRRLNNWISQVPASRIRAIKSLDRVMKTCGIGRLDRLDSMLDRGVDASMLLATELLMRDAPKLWLEYRYGILPTYYDVQSYVKRARNLGKRERLRFTSTMTGLRNTNPSSSERTIAIPTFGDCRIGILTERTKVHSRSVTVGFLVAPQPVGLRPLHDLGIDRLASTAWELTPLSFVADWFFNTSEIIAAHEGQFTHDVLGSWMTVEDRVVQSWQQTGKGYTGVYTSVYSFDVGCIETYVSKQRTKSPEIPILPSFKPRLNIQKVMDLGALALQFGKGLSRLRI